MTFPAARPAESTSLPNENEPLLGQRVAEQQSGGSRNGSHSLNDGPLVLNLRNEAAILLRYSAPLILTYFLQYGQQVLVVVVASQFSTDELAGVSLAITTQNILGFAIFEGMATALDTLCPQAYGASRLADVGMHMLRFMLFIHLVAIPIALLWLFSEQLLELVNVPSATLPFYAGTYLRFSIIGIPGYALFEASKRFMQAQGNFTAAFWVVLLGLPVQILLTWAFVERAKMGVSGIALAVSLTNSIRPILMAAYAICVNPATLQCWPTRKEITSGWNRDWMIMISLAVPGTLMALSEWLCFEILTFCTSYIGTAYLAAQTFLGVVATIAWHVSFSASVACSTRIGQLIGAGHPSVIEKLMIWYSFVFVTIGAFNCGLQIAGSIFSLKVLIHDPDVAEIVKATLPYAAVFVIFDATANWPHAVVRGFGWQSLGAWVTVISNYLLGVPLALFLELGPPHLGIRGLWSGLGTAVAAITVVEAALILMRLRTGTMMGAVGETRAPERADDNSSAERA